MRISERRIKELASNYQTPLYLYDKQMLIKNLNDYYQYFQSELFSCQVLYASKAFSVNKMYQLVKEAKLGVDVVSYGELYTAIKAGIDPNMIYFHGNNKSLAEISYALKSGIYCFVADNMGELEDLVLLCHKLKTKCRVMLRMNVGVEAHTHKYIVTSHLDSKFGILINSTEYFQAIEYLRTQDVITLIGYHSHIGSQIFDMSAFYAAIDKLILLLNNHQEKLALNLGGGFGVYYKDGDHPLTIKEYCQTIIKYTEKKLKANNLEISQLLIEPGRSIVAEAGYQIYTIGNQKKTANKSYCFIDGGMSDNIRPALYQAEYSCNLVGKFKESKDHIYTIAGKCCESGDILIENAKLPKVEKGDLLIVYTCGAYGYSMASNYNKLLLASVVFEGDNESELVCQRQSIQELLEREL